MQLGPKEQQALNDRLALFQEPVRLVMFTQETECQYCAETRSLVEQLAALSDKIEAEVYDFVRDRDQAATYGIDKIPAVAVVGAKDYGVRYYGFPGGYEFGSLLDDMVDVSRGDSGLSPQSRTAVAGLSQDVHLQVFITPT